MRDQDDLGDPSTGRVCARRRTDAGGLDKVDPMTAKIAQAEPAKRREAEPTTPKSA